MEDDRKVGEILDNVTYDDDSYHEDNMEDSEPNNEGIAVRDNREYAKEVWNGMTKKDKQTFFVIATVVGALFISFIAGGVLLGITRNPWLLITAIIGFVGFGFSFPITRKIKSLLMIRKINNSQSAITGIATITNVWVNWQVFDKAKAKAVTLNITCDIQGVEINGDYKLKPDELLQIEPKAESQNHGNRTEFHYEAKQSSVEKIYNVGDKVIVKYILENPKHCVILGKE